MPDLKDLTGMRFGKWTVLYQDENHITKGGNSFTKWICRCDCGAVKSVFTNALLSGKSTSCGCAHSEIAKKVCKRNFETHGESKSRLYKEWAGVKKRCTDENALNYYLYGGRGIKMCDEWSNYEPFRDWALSHGYDDSLTIDRIDVNGNYCPENCRWVTHTVQANNKRNNRYFTHNGETLSMADWARKLGMSYSTLSHRIHKGQPFEVAIQN